MKDFKNIVLVVAAGSGERLPGRVPKQYLKIAGKTILRRTIEQFIKNQNIDAVKVVIRPGNEDLYKEAVEGLEILTPVIGGNSRQESVKNGLDDIEKHSPKNVIIHDANRPLLSQELIDRLVVSLEEKSCVIAALPVRDTLKEAENDIITTTVDRSNKYYAQTPQGFHYKKILDLYNKAESNITDDASLYDFIDDKAFIIEGEYNNFKITTEDDYERAVMILDYKYEFRTGIGFDAHRFGDGDDKIIMLGGVAVDSERPIIAHSDGDVLLHSLVDAMLGSVGAGDIGDHFPPSDKKWKGADSKLFVKHAAEILKDNNAKITNIDIVIICQKPRISSYKQEIKESIASILEIDAARVSVKATTTEKMGFTGREEGIAVQSIVAIKKHCI